MPPAAPINPNAPPGGGAFPGGAPAPVTTTLQSGPLPDIKVYGPYLRFGGYDPISHAYYASVLVVAHQSRSDTAPSLKFWDADVPRWG